MPPGQRMTDVPISRRFSTTSARMPRKLSAGISDTAPTTQYFFPFTPMEISAVASLSGVKSNAMRSHGAFGFVFTVNARSASVRPPAVTRSTIVTSSGLKDRTTALKLCATPPRSPMPPCRIPASPPSASPPITWLCRSFCRHIRLFAAWRVQDMFVWSYTACVPYGSHIIATPARDGLPANLRFLTSWAESPPCNAERVCSMFCPNSSAGIGFAAAVAASAKNGMPTLTIRFMVCFSVDGGSPPTTRRRRGSRSSSRAPRHPS